ncbi:hypothetical protein CDL18_06015 [Mediterraneibacter gnavus]|uniref:Uncharacterized protein n=1 Tax=Mediterraneibacter gnavus TaxID=33038 RepID=A0A2N5NJL8_MEDGN|nr:hypothetical protein CDL18_06015 [Mediterraneibacter gnavus]
MTADINFDGLICGQVVCKNLQHFFKGQHLFSLLCFYSISYYPVWTGKRQGYRQKEKAEEGAAKKRRSSLRKWSVYPCYESLESWVRISFTPSHNCSCRWDISSRSAS